MNTLNIVMDKIEKIKWKNIFKLKIFVEIN